MAIFPGSAISSGGYDINNSLKFNSAGSDYLYWTPSSEGNRQKWTFSVWVKRSKLSTNDAGIFSANLGNELINFPAEDGFQAYINSGAGNLGTNTSTPTLTFRDVSAWYHLMVVWDTAQPIRTERMKLYVNGAQIRPGQLINQVYPDQFAISGINGAIEHSIGRRNNPAGLYFNGYMTEINFIDGLALDPTYFGETDSTYSHWIPKEYTGSYGTNGFYLDFEGTFNNDKSGNGNHFTASGLTSSDVTTDVPTLTSEDTCNYATLSSIDGYPGRIFATDGNLTWNDTTGGSWGRSTISVKTGKWYWEVDNFSTTNYLIGVSDGDESITNYYAYYSGAPTALIYLINGNKFIAGTSTSFISAIATSAVVGFALDADAGSLAVYKNGTLQGTITGLSYGSYSPMVAPAAVGSCTFNFGQKSFSQTPPTGFKKINAYNLDDPAVVPGDYFNTVLYTGDGTTSRSITGVGFQPDFVWGRERNGAAHHTLVDAVRGLSTGGRLSSNRTNAEDNVSNATLASFDSDGFTTGSSANIFNTDGRTFAAWNWKAGNTTTVNEDGSISANTSVNTSAGFSIVTFTSPASGTFTVGHGLGTTPNVIIHKERSRAVNWGMWHDGVMTSASQYLILNTTGALASYSNYWGSAVPTSSVFGMGINASVAASQNLVCYCFAEVEGFSKFGKYVGNGNAEGTFVHTGFRPAFVMVKRTNTSGTEWVMFDNKRDSYNEVIRYIFPSSNAAEATSTSYYGLDFLSNGFKWRRVHTPTNNSGDTYVYMAFAENPFKYANARGTSYDKFVDPAESALTVAQSARFDSASSAHLYRTPSAASNQKTFTWSGWVKRGKVGSGAYTLFSAGNSNTNFFGIYLNYSSTYDDIEINEYPGSVVTKLITTNLFRDPTAWYHIVFAYDTTAATSSNRAKLYVNGSQITDFVTATYPSQNTDARVNSVIKHTVGAQSAAAVSAYFDGCMAEVNFVDGQVLGPESFGYKDSTYGDWRPRSYSDFGPEVDYGPNGFRLDFQSGALGTDVSGGDNDWTLSSISSTNDVVLDSPSNNFCTFNPLDAKGSPTLVEGNLKATINHTEDLAGTMSVSSGKWYWEVELDSFSTSNAASFGVMNVDHVDPLNTSAAWLFYRGSDGAYWDGSGTGSGGGNTFTTGDIIGVALDLDSATNTISFYKNGTFEFTENITNGITWSPFFRQATGTTSSIVALLNCGQDSSFAGSKVRQSNQDDNGIGDFAHTPPTGYLALCTSNLSSPSVVPKDYFNTVTYTGTGANQSIKGLEFSPDFVWIKGRDTTDPHGLFDSVRGAGARLQSSSTSAEFTSTSYLSSFDPDGFSVGTNGQHNGSGEDYVAWNWKAGDSTVSNTDGDITSNVSANTASGFSIVTWTGSSTADDRVGHGLDSAPEFIIYKDRNGTGRPYVWTTAIDGSDDYLFLDGVNGATNIPVTYTSPTSTTISNYGYGSSTTMVAWCFHSVKGFSKIGSYTGNGSTDGPFVYTGFRPAWVMLKETSAATEHWFVYDNKRNAYNLVENRLMPNLTNAADNVVDMGDFTSNGFKLRPTGSYINQFNRSSATVLYMAFAEYPFKYANAR